MVTEKQIVDAWARIRKIDSSIPDEVLDFMKGASLDKLKSMGDENKEWILYWHGGVKQIVKGATPNVAMKNAGLRAEDQKALDFYAPLSTGDNYVFSKETRNWELV